MYVLFVSVARSRSSPGIASSHGVASKALVIEKGLVGVLSLIAEFSALRVRSVCFVMMLQFLVCATCVRR